MSTYVTAMGILTELVHDGVAVNTVRYNDVLSIVRWNETYTVNVTTQR